MKHILPCFIACTLTASLLHAQPTASSRNPDTDWTGVQNLKSTPVSTTAQGKRKPTAEIAREKAEAARVVAAAAKKFYTDHPSHVSAGEARKLEAVHGLLGVTEADKAQEQAALQTARQYRSDKTNPVEARFEVALLLERTEARASLSSKVNGNNPRQLEIIADKLKTEFGNIPEVFNFYVSVARGADMASSHTLATKVLQMPVTRDAKIEAQSILDRQALVNKPLGWKLAELDKKDPVELAKLPAGPTLIYVSIFHPEGTNFSALQQQKRNIPANYKVIYLTLGATEEQIRATKNKAPTPGAHCFEARGAVGPTAEQFYVRQTPYVYVLNRTGALAGFGPLSELPNLATLANR
ncbi:MAG: hypothetical protein V4773_07400 [Verrucomicrobiota bacterium]